MGFLFLLFFVGGLVLFARSLDAKGTTSRVLLAVAILAILVGCVIFQNALNEAASRLSAGPPPF